MDIVNGRDWRIELLRFIATLGIAIFHFEWIYLGHPVYFRHFYLFVEFFFILSGFFLAKNVKRTENNDDYASLKYTYHQAKKLWVPYFIAFIFSFWVYCLVNNVKGLNVLWLLWQSKWEIIYFQLSGFDPTAPVINGVTAYIPALLFAGLIVYYMLSKHYRLTVNILAVVLPVLIYSHIVITYGNLSQWLVYENWYTVGIIRGIAGILIGVFAFEVGHYLKKRRREEIYQRFYCIGKWVSISAIISLVVFRDMISYYDEVVYPYVFAILIMSVYFKKPVFTDNKICMICIFAGKISYNIFLLHYGICHLMKLYIPDYSYRDMGPIYILLIIACGIILDLILKATIRNKA